MKAIMWALCGFNICIYAILRKTSQAGVFKLSTDRNCAVGFVVRLLQLQARS